MTINVDSVPSVSNLLLATRSENTSWCHYDNARWPVRFYRLYRDSAKDGSFTELVSKRITGWTPWVLDTPGDLSFFSVTAENDCGEGPF